jgi:hypothetical protein
MLHALTYSIIDHLKTQVPELSEVVWMYDGVSLTNRVKPFSTIEQMQSNSLLLNAGRTDYEETFRFQVGLFGRSISERSTLSETIKSVLRQPNIPFLNTSVNPATVAGVFVCDVLAVTPMPVDDVADETNKHRVYFDVEVNVYRVNADGINFTQ